MLVGSTLASVCLLEQSVESATLARHFSEIHPHLARPEIPTKRVVSRNTAPPVPFLAPIRSATAGRALTRRPFVDRVGKRRVTDDFVSAATSAATLGVYPKARIGASRR